MSEKYLLEMSPHHVSSYNIFYFQPAKNGIEIESKWAVFKSELDVLLEEVLVLVLW